MEAMCSAHRRFDQTGSMGTWQLCRAGGAGAALARPKARPTLAAWRLAGWGTQYGIDYVADRQAWCDMIAIHGEDASCRRELPRPLHRAQWPLQAPSPRPVSRCPALSISIQQYQQMRPTSSNTHTHIHTICSTATQHSLPAGATSPTDRLEWFASWTPVPTCRPQTCNNVAWAQPTAPTRGRATCLVHHARPPPHHRMPVSFIPCHLTQSHTWMRARLPWHVRTVPAPPPSVAHKPRYRLSPQLEAFILVEPTPPLRPCTSIAPHVTVTP